jgi:hypothetical protein
MPVKKRRALVVKAHKGDYLAAARSMLALANIQIRINPAVSREARKDADFLFRVHRNTGK